MKLQRKKRIGKKTSKKTASGLIRDELRVYLEENKSQKTFLAINCYLSPNILSKRNLTTYLKQFKKEIKVGLSFYQAAQNFLQNCDLSIKNLDTIGTKKKGRDPQWTSLKYAWDMLFAPNSQNYLDDNLKGLVALKSYLIEPDRSPVAFTLPNIKKYDLSCHPVYLNLLQKRYGDNQEAMDRIDNKVNGALVYLRSMLSLIPWIIKKYPSAKLWLTDIFGDSSWQYGTLDIERKSHNIPDYRRSFDLFKRSIQGETYSQLGFSRNLKRHFITTHRPQGALVFLRMIYQLLYGTAELINQKRTAVEAALQELPRQLRARVLQDIKD